MLRRTRVAPPGHGGRERSRSVVSLPLPYFLDHLHTFDRRLRIPSRHDLGWTCRTRAGASATSASDGERWAHHPRPRRGVARVGRDEHHGLRRRAQALGKGRGGARVRVHVGHRRSTRLAAVPSPLPAPAHDRPMPDERTMMVRDLSRGASTAALALLAALDVGLVTVALQPAEARTPEVSLGAADNRTMTPAAPAGASGRARPRPRHSRCTAWSSLWMRRTPGSSAPVRVPTTPPA